MPDDHRVLFPLDSGAYSSLHFCYLLCYVLAVMFLDVSPFLYQKRRTCLVHVYLLLKVHVAFVFAAKRICVSVNLCFADDRNVKRSRNASSLSSIQLLLTPYLLPR
ncbi:membrane-associated protein, putative [Bodo saltans]|uniref:Membrane-associated protein, putative n=1 Tax=Bodo saltans TaxID=75058 RepID=A0A0S4J7B0_BODSA|nr:membrane-associated protein, putative [Bodo saltans]|eukprot:CUG85726.1 membrane-associated protein, putative [Bodo saltans]